MSSNIELREVKGTVRAFRLSDGREIPIPTLPNDHDFVDWAIYLTMDELEASRQYYLDRWNWESGKPLHRTISDGIALEMRMRHELLNGRSILDFTKGLR